jgi:hypothetical protein
VFLTPRSWKGWGFVVFGLLTFFVLDLLALMGEDLATGLVVSLSGMVLGSAVAYAVARIFRRSMGVGIRRTLGIFFGLALTFVIVFAGSALASIPAFPTAQSGSVGA